MDATELKTMAIEATRKLGDELIRASQSLYPGNLDTPVIELNLANNQSVDQYVELMDRLESESKKLFEKAKIYLEASKRLERASEFLKERIKNQMLSLGVLETSGIETKIQLRKTKGQVLIDEMKLPQEFWKAKIVETPDKEMVRKAIEAGKEVPGASILQTYSLVKSLNTEFDLPLANPPLDAKNDYHT